MYTDIFLSLGTNLGDRLSNLEAAITALPADVTVVSRSPVYQTPPWGFVDQPDFLNQVIQVQTRLSPATLLETVKSIEAELGRQPTFRYGPRLIDMDILFYGSLVANHQDLFIPHPRLHERAFVLVPLADLAPDFVHPVLKKSVRDLLREVDQEGVRRYAP